MQEVVTTLASCSALHSLHTQVKMGRRASDPPPQLDLTTQVAALLHALPSMRALSLQSAHCFLRPSPPLLAAFSRLCHLALPVLHLPAPLLALTGLLPRPRRALLLTLPCPAHLAPPFHRLTCLSSLSLHLAAGDDAHPCPMCTMTNFASHGSTGGGGSGGRGGGGGCSNSASTTAPSTSLVPLPPLAALFAGLTPSLTSLTYAPLAFLPPRPPPSPPRSSPSPPSAPYDCSPQPPPPQRKPGPSQPAATATAPESLLPPSLTSLRLFHTDHRPLHLPPLACPSLRRLSFSFNAELAARVPPHACFFPNLQFLELFRVEGSFGWGNGQWLGAMPSLTHFISRCPKRNHSYLLHRLAPSLKFLHLEDPSPKVPLVVLPSLTSLPIDKYCDVSALLSSLAAFSALHTLRFNCFSQVAADRKLSPGRVGRPPALRVLQFRFAQIHALPEFMRAFMSIVRVDLINCGPLEVWLEYLAKFLVFRCLRVDGCSKLPPPPPSLAPLLVLPR
ncbi:unnamed protein product [Closterium sp. Naga37s-1]|nr:unnamed protein product [Closterium sp. Naga37s-1]